MTLDTDVRCKICVLEKRLIERVHAQRSQPDLLRVHFSHVRRELLGSTRKCAASRLRMLTLVNAIDFMCDEVDDLVATTAVAPESATSAPVVEPDTEHLIVLIHDMSGAFCDTLNEHLFVTSSNTAWLLVLKRVLDSLIAIT